MKKRILIVEDEVFIAEELASILDELGFEVTDIAFDTESAIQAIQKQTPDLAILDIRMHGKNQGFEIAEYINENLDIPFMFLTSFADESTVVEASKLKPNAYILKPFNNLDIFSTLSIVFESFEKKSNKIVFKTGHEKVVIDPSEILWIKSDDNYIEVNTIDKRHVIRATIGAFLDEFKLNDLVRSHRSYVINLNQIASLNSRSVTINNTEIPVSRKHLKNLRDLLES